jgi:hypothetical protein
MKLLGEVWRKGIAHGKFTAAFKIQLYPHDQFKKQVDFNSGGMGNPFRNTQF